jgi:CheY-like chemotaxis protein/HPt (histidine-containing phosphotransfer) domain-containing protein
MYSSKPINFIIDVDENIPTMLFGDHLRIKQVLNNLLSNAFKYTHGGEVKLSVEVESMPPAHIAAHDEAAAQVILVFKVSDTGQGMNKDQLDVLFDEYTRFNFEANRATIGTGLGMNITKQLVDMMNGEIFVESEVDKGTVFTLRLPQEVAGEGVLGKELVENLKLLHFDKLPHIKKAPQIIRDYMPYGRVLVVDDVETNLYVARGLMAPYGLSVDSVTSGFEVIEIVKKGISYDIIFMDHFMPRMDGIEATKILRKMGYTNPIIALTADAIAGQAEMFMQNGFDGFISKPIDIRQLNAALNSLVRDKYPSDVVEAARRLRNDQMKFAKENTPQLFAHRQILELFVKDAEKAINSLEEIDNNKYRRSNDVKLYIITVHSLKSALLHIGEHDLSVEALKLEKAGREGNIELVAKESLAFLGKIKAVIKKIKKIIFDDSNEVKYSVKIKDSEMALLKEKLEIIIASCAEYDNKPAEDALAILLAETFPQETYDLLNKITGYLLHSDFDEAARIARELLDRNADS